MVHLPADMVASEEWPEVFQALIYDVLVRSHEAINLIYM